MPVDFQARLYAANVDVLADEALYRAAYRAATNERRQKADRYSFPGGKRLCLGAELLLEKGLRDLGIDCRDLSYRYGENGKPYLKKDRGVCFNLSHSGTYAMCALASCEIGCDIEKIAELRTGTGRETALGNKWKIAERFFAPEEYERILEQRTEKKRQELFFRFWTLKESFLKATGFGIGFGLDRFCIRLGDGEIRVEQPADGKHYYFREYGDIDGYRCAACSVEDRFEDRVRLTDLRKVIEEEKNI